MARAPGSGYECRVTVISPAIATALDSVPSLETVAAIASDSVAPVIRLTEADLPRCSQLGVSRGWGAEAAKWSLLFEVGEVYGLEDSDGRLIATACLDGKARVWDVASGVVKVYPA